MIAQSTITCPNCGTSKTETMPTDACQFFYDCTGCGRLLRPKPGDCCVFCSFGSVPCPPIQEAGSRGAREPKPVACCLGAGEYRDRIAWIESLTRRALRRHARNDLALTLSYALEAVSDVRHMVEQERICCPFLDFDMNESPDAVNVTSSIPPWLM